ncbi:MAG: EF-P lysine aminoacylase GenX [Candidatus Magasanikbacteria bacterium RIFOXYC2_FULL_42_28]|uniref:EF-P lysine aminoacylase GenX n=1 Tax=Candidatus Magasanikbacteria bacterium RIFOXYC2_FULL_42_28 TaxID=1798704 RepID=A0A1F6NVT3_9BACT|nr:MAG: EF-P lysine aminoacylase GenX [Candidatus Magasanikbacteria bacterium RIFOXYC2_FULL_42_28]
MSTWSELKNNPRLREIYETRLRIISLIREWFISAEFLEADTPIALRLPGQEPYLNPVAVDFNDSTGRSERFYLQTSPEFSLKKLLAAGFNNIFQLAKCFRNTESFGGTHNTEFTMLEWYRAPGSLKDVMDDTENLFKFVGKELGAVKFPSPARGEGEGEVGAWRWEQSWDRKSMRQIWQEYLGVELNDYLTVETIKILANKLDCGLEGEAEYEDYFFKIFLNKIETNLGKDKPVFIYDYPAQMCSLSRPSADNRYAERFELYINGLEMANAFGELTDAEAQAKNLEKDRALREKLGRSTWPVDPDFIGALRSGIPGNCAGGSSLGVDRMVMLFTGAKDINEVIFQSVSDQLSENY